MTPNEIALATIAFLSPYLIEGGKELAKSAGKEVWELIKKPFTSDKEKALLTDLEKNPDNQIVQGKVIGKLEEYLEANPELLKSLTELLSKAKSESINISQSKNVNTGNVNTGGGDFRIGDNK
jgi:hypothetical protein